VAFALEIQDLVKRYPKTEALGGVSLTISEGEIFALLGPNGAGKTTLIGAVCSIVKKTSGRIRIFGHDLDEAPLLPRYDVGLVPQELNFDPFLTVEGSLRIQQGYYGRTFDAAYVTEVLEALSLSEKRHAPTRTLSGGMKRRLLIAKALIHRPRLVFLDEPTAGVDVELRRDLWTYVRTLRARGTTVVLTTHYLEEAEALADRVGIIDQGRLLVVEEKASLMRRLGEKRLVVRLGPETPTRGSAAEGALDWARIAPGAQRSEDGRELVYIERQGKPSSSEVLKALYASGAEVTEVETRKSRLEDVLLEVLRGSERREQGAP
jgi:ABC-2 type transport system ATP-binding protein